MRPQFGVGDCVVAGFVLGAWATAAFGNDEDDCCCCYVSFCGYMSTVTPAIYHFPLLDASTFMSRLAGLMSGTPQQILKKVQGLSAGDRFAVLSKGSAPIV